MHFFTESGFGLTVYLNLDSLIKYPHSLPLIAKVASLQKNKLNKLKIEAS